MVRALALALALTSGCAHTGRAQVPPLAGGPPFTPAQIRDAMPPGSRFLWQVTLPVGEQWTAWTVLDADARRVTLRYSDLHEDGRTVAGEPWDSTATWLELRDHADYSQAEAVHVEADTLTTPLGTFEVLRYHVRQRDEAGRTIDSVYDFAVDLPGPPIHLHQHIDGQFAQELLLLERQPRP